MVDSASQINVFMLGKLLRKDIRFRKLAFEIMFYENNLA